MRVVDLARDGDKLSVLIAQRKLAGLTSYNILANPLYRTMFQLQRVEVANGFHSLQDTLNVRKDTAVDLTQDRSLYAATTTTRQTTPL